jgi:hypothetical protein
VEVSLEDNGLCGRGILEEGCLRKVVLGVEMVLDEVCVVLV